MSVRALTIIWDHYPHGGGELLVALALADWSNDDGESLHPSMRAIARKTRLQSRQAQRHVHAMIGAGFLEVLGNAHGGARTATATRRLRLDLIGQLPVIGRTPRTAARSVTDVTPVTEDTRTRGVTDDAEGCHGRRERGVVDDTQAVIEPSENRERDKTATPPVGVAAPSPTGNSQKSKRASKGGPLLPPEFYQFTLTPALLDWGKGHGFGEKYMRQQFAYFVDYCESNGKLYINYAAAFRNCCRKNWAGSDPKEGVRTLSMS